MSHLVLYDGVCGLCNWAVRLILKHDRQARFKFASIQSQYGLDLLSQHRYTPDTLDSFVLLIDQGTPDERFLIRSDAALHVGGALGGLWRLLRILRILPRSIRDWLYGIVARNRYRWFGKYDACPIPEPEYRDRFVG
jgi:predicted DCC family thiol-disulfide oxidoreductase YuxK